MVLIIHQYPWIFNRKSRYHQKRLTFSHDNDTLTKD